MLGDLRSTLGDRISDLLSGQSGRDEELQRRFNLLQDESDRRFNTAATEVGRRAAALGRTGLGATSTSFGDLGAERARELANAQERLSLEAAEADRRDMFQALGLGTEFSGQLGAENLTREEFALRERMQESELKVRSSIARAQIAAQDRATQAGLEAQRMGLDAQAQRQASDLAFRREMSNQSAEIEVARLEFAQTQQDFQNAFQERGFERTLERDAASDFFSTLALLQNAGGDVNDLAPAFGNLQNAFSSGANQFGAQAQTAGQQAGDALVSSILALPNFGGPAVSPTVPVGPVATSGLPGLPLG
jgi:hypothetical protein